MSHKRDMPESLSPPTRDRARTESAIVEAGMEIVRRSGWEALNVQTLAAQAGVDRKLVYRYFGGAEGVAETLAARLHARLAERLASAPPVRAAGYRDFMRSTLTAYLDALRREPLIVRLIAWELTDASPVYRRTEAARAEVLQTWTSARRAGRPRPLVGDPAALDAVMLAAVQHVAIVAHARGRLAGFEMNELGWIRTLHALERLVQAYPPD